MILIIQILAVILGILGIIGCILPILPGPLLSLLGIFLLQRFTPQDRSTPFLLTMSLLTIITLLSDYFLPLVGAKRYGGTKAGMWGLSIGAIIGFFVLPPVGLIIGPLVGAFLGELRQKKDKQHARRAARGSFLGSGVSLLLKLTVSIIHIRYILHAVR